MMAPSVTEFAKLPLKPGADMTAGSDDHKILMASFDTLLAQPGCQRCYYGVQVEDPSIVRMIIDWETHDAHIAFTKADSYGPFVKSLGPILGGAPALHHIVFKPHPPREALSDTTAPATEVLMMYFPTDTSEGEKATLQANVKKALANIGAATPAMRHVVSGWLFEDAIDYEQAPGGKATAMCTLLAWDSVQAHLDCRETQVFSDNIPAIRQAPGMSGMAVYHIHSVELQKGGA